jgi:sugar lactone lactonase YvrE
MRPWTRGLVVLLAVAGAAVLLGLLLPSPIDPVAFTPPPKQRRHPKGYDANLDLQQARRFAEGRVRGPEDLAFDEKARLYTGTADGKILRVGLLNDSVEEFATTGGRPLGLHFDGRGRLIVCDARKGLLAIDGEGRVTTLATEAGGRPFRFTNNLDVAGDGTVYFTDSSDSRGPDEYLYDLLEGKPRGRLLRLDPISGRVDTLADGFFFANGVALSADESFLLVAETYRYRIMRYWLKGPRAGTADTFADNLPGFPDNISRDTRGTFWVAFFTVRNDFLDAIQPHPLAKKLLARLPDIFWPKPARYGFVANLNARGQCLKSFHDPTGERVWQVTTARERDGILYLGTLHNAWLARYTLRQPYVPLPGIGVK